MNVHAEKFERVTLVTLNRPKVRNAVDRATAQALHAAFVAFEQDDRASLARRGPLCPGRWQARRISIKMAPSALT
jgi:hypothetical protein